MGKAGEDESELGEHGDLEMYLAIRNNIDYHDFNNILYILLLREIELSELWNHLWKSK